MSRDFVTHGKTPLTTREERLEHALKSILGLYHERHLLLDKERAMLPFEMKEVALKALAEGRETARG